MMQKVERWRRHVERWGDEECNWKIF